MSQVVQYICPILLGPPIVCLYTLTILSLTPSILLIFCKYTINDCSQSVALQLPLPTYQLQGTNIGLVVCVALI